MRYDPDERPDPATWHDHDDDVRYAAIAAGHGEPSDALHNPGTNWRMHHRLTLVVEDQIAGGEPEATGATMDRLEALGLRRHAAVHAIMDVMLARMARGQPFDAAEWKASLDRIEPSDWLAAKFRQHLAATDE